MITKYRLSQISKISNTVICVIFVIAFMYAFINLFVHFPTHTSMVLILNVLNMNPNFHPFMHPSTPNRCPEMYDACALPYTRTELVDTQCTHTHTRKHTHSHTYRQTHSETHELTHQKRHEGGDIFHGTWRVYVGVWGVKKRTVRAMEEGDYTTMTET